MDRPSEQSQSCRISFPPWKIRDVLWIVIVVLIAQFLFPKIAEVLFFSDLDLTTDYGGSWENVEHALVICEFLILGSIESLLFIFSIYIVCYRHNLSLLHIGWRWDFSREWWYRAVIIGLAYVVLYIFFTLWYAGDLDYFLQEGKLPLGWGYVGHEGPEGEYVTVWSGEPLRLISKSFFPIAEEVFFRGVSYHVFKKRFGVLGGMAISSLFFVIWHDKIYNYAKIDMYMMVLLFVFDLFIIGIIACVLYEKSKSLGPAIIFHSVVNGVQETFLSIFN